MITNPLHSGMFPGVKYMYDKVLFDLLLLNVNLWQNIYSIMLGQGFVPDDAVYFEYEVHSVLPIEEWDARLCQPSQHTSFSFIQTEPTFSDVPDPVIVPD
jgi:hypothetical protein